jgi:hypothetical protein
MEKLDPSLDSEDGSALIVSEEIVIVIASYCYAMFTD